MVRKGLLIWSIVMLLGMVVSGCSSSAEVAAPVTAGENTEAEQEIEKDGKSEETQEEISEESIGDIFTIGFVQGERNLTGKKLIQCVTGKFSAKKMGMS